MKNQILHRRQSAGKSKGPVSDLQGMEIPTHIPAVGMTWGNQATGKPLFSSYKMREGWGR